MSRSLREAVKDGGYERFVAPNSRGAGELRGKRTENPREGFVSTLAQT